MISKKEIYTNEIGNCITNIIFYQNEIAKTNDDFFYQNEIKRMKEKIEKLKNALKDYNF